MKRIAFFGSSSFSIDSLNALIDSDNEVSVIFTRPPKPKGRGYVVTPTEVQLLAEKFSIPVCFDMSAFDFTSVDINVVSSYGAFLPDSVLYAPRFESINVHPSLLPRWRGATPLEHGIIYDDVTGVTIMKMCAKLDAGDILMQKEFAIHNQDYETLSKELAVLGGKMLVEVISNIENIIPIKQDEAQVTYASKFSNFNIDWNDSAELIARKIRALKGLRCTFNDTIGAKILSATYLSGSDSNEIKLVTSKDDMQIFCKGGILIPIVIQPDSKKPMQIGDFVRGYRPIAVCSKIND